MNDWRSIHNLIVPSAPLSAADVAEHGAFTEEEMAAARRALHGEPPGAAGAA